MAWRINSNNLLVICRGNVHFRVFIIFDLRRIFIDLFDEWRLLFQIDQRILRKIFRVRDSLFLLNRCVIHLLLNLSGSELLFQLSYLLYQSKLVANFNLKPLLHLMCLLLQLQQKLNLFLIYVRSNLRPYGSICHKGLLTNLLF